MYKTTIYRNSVIAVILSASFGVSVPAFGTEMLKKDTLSTHKNLKEVQVKGSRKNELRAPLPSQTLSSSEISQLNANNIADVAKHFAGVTIKDYGGIGGLKTISVRGLSAEHTGVAYDGLLMSDIQSGVIDLSQFCVENIESVTLDNGQPANMLQPARMFSTSSVLSIQNKLPEYHVGKPLTGYAGIKAGSFGLINPTLLLEHYLTRRLSVSLSANAIVANGRYPFEINTSNYGTNMVRNVRSNTDVSSLFSELNMVYLFRPEEKLAFKLNEYYCDRGIPGSVIIDNYYNAKGRLRDNNQMAQLTYGNKYNHSFQYQFGAKYSNQALHFEDAGVNYAQTDAGKRVDDYRQKEYYMTASALWRPNEHLNISAATDVYYNTLFTESTLTFRKSASPTRTTSLTNIAAKYTEERFSVGASLLYTDCHENSGDTSAMPYRRRFSPTAFASWQATADGSLLLRAFYKEIFRLPTFTELYYQNFGYKLLEPEKSRQINLGMTYQTHNLPFLSSLSYTADVYYNRVSDKITIVYGMPLSSIRNIGRVEIKGCDLKVSATKQINSKQELTLDAAYSFQLAQDFDTNPNTYGDIIPYTPLHSGSANCTYRLSWFSAGYNMLFAGKRYSGQNSNKDNYLAPYVEQSLFARYVYNKFTFTAELINLANVNYMIIKYYPMPGRNFRLGMNYKF